MSVHGNLIPSKGFHFRPLNDKNENDDSATKKNANNATPPELQRNEAAARGKATNPRSNETSDPIDNDVENNNDESRVNGDEDDPCLRKKKKEIPEDDKVVRKFRGTPGSDPRFQQQNQTLRCYVMYTDFYRCENILGQGHEACTWFRDVFTSICPNDWIERWDQWRAEGRFPWRSAKTPTQYPDNRYGV